MSAARFIKWPRDMPPAVGASCLVASSTLLGPLLVIDD